MKQFLANEDGTIPEGVDVALLAREGIPIVIPTKRGIPSVGMTWEEGEPALDSQGRLIQTWVEVPSPPIVPDLNSNQGG